MTQKFQKQRNGLREANKLRFWKRAKNPPPRESARFPPVSIAILVVLQRIQSVYDSDLYSTHVHISRAGFHLFYFKETVYLLTSVSFFSV